MKIAYVCQSYLPTTSGAALVVRRLVEGISARGHSVVVLAPSDYGHGYIERADKFIVVRLRSFKNPIRIDHHFTFWSQNEIFNTLRQFKPDVMHLHDPLNLGVSGIRSARRLIIPALVTIHQLPWFISSYIAKTQLTKSLIESSLWQYSKWFLRQCDATITPSQTIANIIRIQTGICPKVISNGVDLSLFSPHTKKPNESEELCSKYHIRPEHPVILFVGRLDPDKNIEIVLHAAAKVMRAMQVQLVVVGDGTRREELIQLSKSIGIHQHCYFPGFISQNGDLPGIYRLATVFVTASILEIQSSVVLEGAASGLPVITVQASSMSELVEDGRNGYLVPPWDVNALAERLIFLLRSPSKIKMMGKASRILAERHSNKIFIDAHEKIYESTAQHVKSITTLPTSQNPVQN